MRLAIGVIRNHVPEVIPISMENRLVLIGQDLDIDWLRKQLETCAVTAVSGENAIVLAQP
jgi:Cobalamin synthesis protein cobW C-terminal domain